VDVSSRNIREGGGVDGLAFERDVPNRSWEVGRHRKKYGNLSTGQKGSQALTAFCSIGVTLSVFQGNHENR